MHYAGDLSLVSSDSLDEPLLSDPGSLLAGRQQTVVSRPEPGYRAFDIET